MCEASQQQGVAEGAGSSGNGHLKAGKNTTSGGDDSDATQSTNAEMLDAENPKTICTAKMRVISPGGAKLR